MIVVHFLLLFQILHLLLAKWICICFFNFFLFLLFRHLFLRIVQSIFLSCIRFIEALQFHFFLCNSIFSFCVLLGFGCLLVFIKYLKVSILNSSLSNFVFLIFSAAPTYTVPEATA